MAVDLKYRAYDAVRVHLMEAGQEALDLPQLEALDFPDQASAVIKGSLVAALQLCAAMAGGDPDQLAEMRAALAGDLPRLLDSVFGSALDDMGGRSLQ